ncbi:MAG: hypothetical protein MR283_07075 [Erysipelotrichaceae bacterium]|nr:hypothetical protein [Erysipelotrichaceae bacterium]MCI7359029.1 hypothetical protein [Parabacteroides sp.]
MRILNISHVYLTRVVSKTLLENFIKSLDGIEGEITKFDEDLWSGLFDYILVKDKEHYTVVFKNGTEVDV